MGRSHVLSRSFTWHWGWVTFVITHHSPTLHLSPHIQHCQSPQRITIMELTALNLINLQTLLLSIPIVALSITNFYFTGHALHTFGEYFPPGSYEWQNPGQGYTQPKGPAKQVTLRYDYAPENMILVSTALSILAGLFGIAGFWTARKVRSYLLFPSISLIDQLSCANTRRKKSPKLSTFWATSTLSTSTAAFVATFISIIVSSVKYESRANTTCRWSEGRMSNPQPFTCTREIVACELINFLTETNWADNRRVCRETKGARVILVPLTVLTFVSVALYGLRIYMLRNVKSVDDSAEERVEGLQREE